MQPPRLRKSLTREDVLALGRQLAPSAAVMGRLRVLLATSDADFEEVIGLIRLDPALTFHVVRLSNSVLFGVRDHSDSLEEAAGRVGFAELYRVVCLAATHQLCQRDLAAYQLQASRLWENSVATAAAAEVLAIPAGCDPGLSYTTGLLRNLGRVIIDGFAGGRVYPGELASPQVTDWEKAEFGMNSAEITALLLEHWRFPRDVVEAVRAHHDPLVAGESNAGACVLNLACGVTARFGLDLPGEATCWIRSEAKMTMVGVNDALLERCATNARAHYMALCASVA